LSFVMTQIDLSPPADWLEDFPLSKPPFRELNNSVEWVLRLPKNVDELRKELSFSDASVNKVREDMESLVEIYVNVHTTAIKYKSDILPSIITLARNLNAHASIVNRYYDVLYDAVKSLIDGEVGLSWSPTDLIGLITNHIRRRMSQLINMAGKTASEVNGIKDRFDDYKSHVTKNVGRLKARRDPSVAVATLETRSTFKGSSHSQTTGKVSFGEDEGSSLDTLQLQNELLDSGLRDFFGY